MGLLCLFSFLSLLGVLSHLGLLSLLSLLCLIGVSRLLILLGVYLCPFGVGGPSIGAYKTEKTIKEYKDS